MGYFVFKVAVSALLIAFISEAGKRNATVAGLLAALPVISLLSFVWMHAEAVSETQIANVAGNIFWLVLPSLVLFLLFPFLLRAGWGFWASLAVASTITAACFAFAATIGTKLGMLR